MEFLNPTAFYPAAEGLVSWLLRAVVLGTLATALTALVLTSFRRRVRPTLHAALWVIVLLRFVLPETPGWSFSLASLAGSWSTPAAARASTSPAMQPAGGDWNVFPMTALSPAVVEPSAPAAAPQSWMLVLALGYVFAVAALAAIRIASYRRFVARARALPVADEGVRQLVSDVCRRSGVQRLPDVRVSDDAAAPYVFGLLRPTLVLSNRCQEDAAELETILFHEIAHLRRGDLWARGLQWIAGTLLFFWPVVAWVNRRIDLAREHACDEWALRNGKLSPSQYARCLLRAAQPTRGRWPAFQPAAMAANSQQMERRIEVILNSPSSSRGGMLRFLAGVGFIGWSAFVLSGAIAAPDDKPSTPPAEEVEIVVGQPLGDEPFDVLLQHVGSLEGHVMWLSSDDADGEAAVHVAAIRGPSAEKLAQFLADHPTADANADGTLSASEHSAFLAALALKAPAGVLANFPDADRDTDGALSPIEAARLITVPPMPKVLPRIRWNATEAPADGIPADVLDKLPEDVRAKIAEGKSQVKVMRLNDGKAGQPVVVETNVDEGDGQTKVIRVHAGEGEVNADEEVVVHRLGAKIEGKPLASAWVLENISATPTAEEITPLIPLVEAAPLAAFLEMNPAADADKNGTLTKEERSAFLEAQAAKMRSRVLEKFPAADVNGDGKLTDEELHNHLKSQAPVGGMMKRVRVEAGADGEVKVEVDEDGPQ